MDQAPRPGDRSDETMSSGGSFGGSFGGGFGGYGGGLHASAQPAPAAAAADDLIKETTTQAFVKDVIEESMNQPVLVDFWAPWCGPCKQLTPIIEKVVKNAKGKVKLVKMNIDDHPQVAGQLGIQSIPAVIAFDKGQGVDGFMGALPESQITTFIEKLAGKVVDEVAEALAAADAALIEGDAAGAMQIYASVVQAEPENIHAYVGIARCQLEVGQVEAAENVLSKIPAAKQNDPAVAAVRAKIDVAKAAADLGPIHELTEKVAANPKDHASRLDLAIALNAKDKREEAVDHLIEIFKQDRAWNEDAARKQLVQFFEAWGPMDEAAIAGRRKLSSLMFR
jgi:putative thioredoxin